MVHTSGPLFFTVIFLIGIEQIFHEYDFLERVFFLNIAKHSYMSFIVFSIFLLMFDETDDKISFESCASEP